MSINRLKTSIPGYFNQQKNYTVRQQHRNKEGSAKKSSTLPNTNLSIQDKLDLKVVSSVQNMKKMDQEVEQSEVYMNNTKPRKSKFQGKKKYNKALPRNKSQKEDTEYNQCSKKRSAKLMAKEEENSEYYSEHTAFKDQNKSSSKEKNSVTFKNSNSGDSMVLRTRQRSSQMESNELLLSKSRSYRSHTAKNELQNEYDREWSQDLPESITRKERKYLLSFGDQAERNRELSSMMESIEHSNSASKSRLAVVQSRRSHIKPNANLKRNYRASTGSKFERSSDKISESQQSNTSNDVDSSMGKGIKQQWGENKSTLGNRKMEIVSGIRARGVKAKEIAGRSQKSSPKGKNCNTPQSKDSMTPIPFPNFELEENTPLRTKIEVVEHVQPLSKTTKVVEKTEEEFEITQMKEEKPMRVIEKVQNQPKDVTVPLVTEIQPKSLRDSSYDIAEQMGHQNVSRLTPNKLSEEKHVIENIKEQWGNTRSPAKITNRLIHPIQESSSPMQPILEEDSEFKTPLPKKPRSATKQESDEKLMENMYTFPMRIDFNYRPTEFDTIILPKKLQLIFEFFTELDNAINNCKRRGKMPTLTNIKPFVEQVTNRTFNIDHFRKVYYVAPELYYYQWQMVNGNHDLRIEIPDNIDEIITKVHKKGASVMVRHSPLSEAMTNFLTNKRKIIVRTRLILYMEKLHSNYLTQRGIEAKSFGPVEGWHPNFDIQSVMDLPSKTLNNMPKGRKSETVAEFLKNKNIKSVLLKRASENACKDSSLKADIVQHTQSTNPSSIYGSAEKRSPAKITNGSVSPAFFKRIESKERMYKEEKKILEDQSNLEESKRKMELMLKIAQAVKSVFSVKGKVNTLFLNHVLKYLNDSQRGNFYSKKELINTLKEISDVVPEWLTLKQHERGFLVKISKTNISTIRNKIMNHTRTLQ
jgi:hypothetical protein